MGGSRSILVGVVLSFLVVGLVFWTLWSGDRPPRNEPSNGAVSEPDLEFEPEVEPGSEAAVEQPATPTDTVPSGGSLQGMVYLDDSMTLAAGASVVAIVPGTRDYAGKTLADGSG